MRRLVPSKFQFIIESQINVFSDFYLLEDILKGWSLIWIFTPGLFH